MSRPARTGRRGGRERPEAARRARASAAARAPAALSELGGDQVEGRRAVLELLTVGEHRARVFLAEDQDPSRSWTA